MVYVLNELKGLDFVKDLIVQMQWGVPAVSIFLAASVVGSCHLILHLLDASSALYATTTLQL